MSLTSRATSWGFASELALAAVLTRRRMRRKKRTHPVRRQKKCPQPWTLLLRMIQKKKEFSSYERDPEEFLPSGKCSAWDYNFNLNQFEHDYRVIIQRETSLDGYFGTHYEQEVQIIPHQSRTLVISVRYLGGMIS